MAPRPGPVEKLKTAESFDNVLENGEAMTVNTTSLSCVCLKEKLPQEDSPYLKLLPDHDRLIVEVEKYFETLLQDLTEVVLSKDLYTGLANCTARLKWYINSFGLRFSKDRHVRLIHLFLELLTMDSCPERIIQSLCDVIVLLLRKNRLLRAKDLTIQWRPLYKMLHQYTYKSSYGSISLTPTVLNLKRVIRVGNRYFGKDALDEILEEISPMLCPDSGAMKMGLEFLNYFLPYYEPSSSAKLANFIETILNTWDVWCNNYSYWQSEIYGLLGTIAIDFRQFDWTPYLPVIHSRLRENASSLSNRGEDEQKAFLREMSLWIISTFGNNNKSARDHFKDTLLFYNRSSSDDFPPVLPYLTSMLANRLKRERYVAEDKRSNARPLTDEDVDFVTRTIFVMCVDHHVESCAGSSILRDLAYLNPKLVIPTILEKYYLSLDRVEEPGRFIITLDWVQQIMSALICWEENYLSKEKHASVIELFYSLLPAIGPNDLQITKMVLDAFRVLFQRIPMIDCSALASTEPEEHWKRFCLSTSRFKDLCCQFLDKILTLIIFSEYENISVIDNADRTPEFDFEDESIDAMLWNVFHPLAMNSSAEICEVMTQKIVEFAFSRILETHFSGKLFASVCEAFVTARPESVLPLLLPPLVESLKKAISDEVGEILPPELDFGLLLLSKAVECSGHVLLQNKKYFNEIIPLILTLEMNAAKPKVCLTITQLLYSLCSVYPLETNILQKIKNGHLPSPQEWIHKMNIKTDRIDAHWHVPTTDGLDWAIELFSKIFDQKDCFLREQISSPNQNAYSDSILKQKLLNALTIMNAAFEGISCALAPESTKTTGANGRTPLQPFCYSRWNESKAQNIEPIRRHYFETLCSLLEYLNKFRPDETDMFGKVVECFKSLTDHSHEFTLFARERSLFGGFIIRNDILSPRWLSFRPEFIIQAYVVYRNIFRVREPGFYMMTPFREEVCSKLLDLCTNRYFVVRISAQINLKYFLIMFPNAMPHSIPKLLEKIHEETLLHEVKGAFHTILELKDQSIHGNNWENLCKIWNSVLQSPFSDHQSVTWVQDDIVSAIEFYFTIFPSEEDLMIPSKAIDECNLLRQTILLVNQNKWGIDREPNNKIWFNLLIDNLLETGTSSSSWYIKHRVCKMLAKLVNKSLPMTIPMIEYFYDIILSDNMTLRTSGLQVLSKLFLLFKRHIPHRTVKTEVLLQENQFESFHEFAQYKTTSDLSKNRSQNFYIHPNHFGFSYVPQNLNLKIETEEFSLENEAEQIQVFCAQSLLYFNNSNYVKQFLLMHGSDSIDDLDRYIRHTFSSFARSNGPEALTVLLKEVCDMLESMKEEKEREKQLLIHSIIFGILRGMKYWRDETVASFWEISLKPILETCWEMLTEETEESWMTIGAVVLRNRDPMKYGFFIQYLYNKFETSIHDSSITSVKPFIDIGAFCGALMVFSWRGALFHDELFKTFYEFVFDQPSPFQNIRVMVGGLLGYMVGTREHIKKNNPALEAVLNRKEKKVLSVEELMHIFKSKFADLYEEISSSDTLSDQTRQRIFSFKTVLGCLRSMCNCIHPSMYEIVPLTCQFINYVQEPEVEELCEDMLNRLCSWNEIPSDCFDTILTSSIEVTKMDSWRSRYAIVTFLGGILHSNLHLVKGNPRSEEFNALILKLVYDTNFEVRELASGYLTYLIQFSVLNEPLELLEKFKGEVQTCKIRNHQKSKDHNLVNDISSWHSAVAGLSAFVFSNQGKERMPDYLPELLTFMTAQIADNTPLQIRAQVRDSLLYFRRYYQDNWIEHKKRFTEDQINVLSNALVNSSYHV